MIQDEKQQQYARATFGDCEESAVEKAMQLIGKNCYLPSEALEKKLELWEDTAVLFMKPAGLEPNKLQMAIALAVAF